MKTKQGSLFCAIGSPDMVISDAQLQEQLSALIDFLGAKDDVLLIPPDYTRFESQAGKITRMICEKYNFIESSTATESAEEGTSTASTTKPATPNIEILPALGTHAPMTKPEITSMFGQKLGEKEPSPFLIHDWRNDVVTIGEAPASMVRAATHDQVDQPWPVQLNKIVWNKRQNKKSLVLSIGQVVPHEVMGMANYNKNIFVGTGGVQSIGLSHFIGAVHGMESLMGQGDNPLRSILNYASKTYLEDELALWYILTVMGPDETTGAPCMRGLFIGNDIQCYTQACELSRQVNFTLVDKPITRCVVYLNENKFHSTWLGNKAIYRTRMAMADGGELIVLGPGIRKFGEDDEIDKLVRKYGYKGTPHSLKMMKENDDLSDQLTTVAHLIHGSTEGRFAVTYCPGHLSKAEIEQAGFQYADVSTMLKRYNPDTLQTGWNTDQEGGFFFVKDPALGLWAHESRLGDT